MIRIEKVCSSLVIDQLLVGKHSGEMENINLEDNDIDQDINEQIKSLESEINGLIDQLDDAEGGDVIFEDVDSDDLADFELDIKTGLIDSEDVKTELSAVDPLKLASANQEALVRTNDIKEEIDNMHTNIDSGINKGKFNTQTYFHIFD